MREGGCGQTSRDMQRFTCGLRALLFWPRSHQPGRRSHAAGQGGTHSEQPATGAQPCEEWPGCRVAWQAAGAAPKRWLVTGRMMLARGQMGPSIGWPAPLLTAGT